MADQYTFTALRTELNRRLGGRSDTVSLGRAGEFLNSAQLWLAKAAIELPRLDQVATIYVVDDQSEYNLLSVQANFTAADALNAVDIITGPPTWVTIDEELVIGPTEFRPYLASLADILGLRSIQNVTSGWRMTRLAWRDWRWIQPNQATGAPVRWARHANLLAVDPQPDGTYELKLDYRRRPVADVIDVDSEWHELLLELGCYLGFQAYGLPDRAKAQAAMLPAWVLGRLAVPLTESEWEAEWDDELGVVPATGWA